MSWAITSSNCKKSDKNKQINKHSSCWKSERKLEERGNKKVATGENLWAEKFPPDYMKLASRVMTYTADIFGEIGH